jgi:MEDS: MEthanogen/methylotroph, DcmR Sensory domain
MGRTVAPISFGGSDLGEVRHICAFFNGDEEKYRVLLPFIKDGFACGDRAVHVVSPHQWEDHLGHLAGAGIDATAARQSGQLELRTNVEAYLRDGHFDQERMLESFEQMASEPRRGFRIDRIVCHMEWAADSPSHLNDLVEFESRVNHVWQRHDDAVICVYDLQRFGGDTVVDMIRTHPLILIGGIVQHNPFFVPPEEFLKERRERQLSRSAPRPATA